MAGQWAQYDGSNWMCVAQNTQNNSNPPSTTNSDWVSSYTYPGCSSVTFAPPDDVIPFRTPNNQNTTTWPDRYVVNSNGQFTYIPSLSDLTIYSDNTKSTVLIAAGSQITATPNGNVNQVDEYIEAVQNYSGVNTGTTYWIDPSVKVPDSKLIISYGSNSAPWYPVHVNTNGSWHFDKEDRVSSTIDGPPGVSDWTAYDRTLDGNFPGNNNVTWTWPWSYPQKAFGFSLTSVPTYYGIKDLSNGVKRSTADIAPIAQELKNLQWVTAFNYADFQNGGAWASGTGPKDGPHPSGEPEFPLTIAASNQVAQTYDAASNSYATLPFTTSGTTDPTGSLYYNIGIFHDPNDAGDPPDLDAVYVTIANRRTWPIIYNSDHTQVVAQDRTTSTAYNYLGAIDARIVDFQLKPNGWTDYQGNPVNWGSKYSYYTITDLRGKDLQRSTDNGATWSDAGTELVNPISSSSLFRIDLDPGEGTLLRIAPATSVELGRTPYAGMAYNNGHRICDISDPCAPHDHGVVWEDNGKIMFCRTQEEASPGDPIGTFLANNPPGPDAKYQVKTVYAPAANSNHEADGHNPSIAAKGDTVAIVYSIDDFADTKNAPRSVVFAMSSVSSNYSTWTTTAVNNPSFPPPYIAPMVKDISGNVPGMTTSYDLLTPAITPSLDGYFVAYSESELAPLCFLITTAGGPSVHPLSPSAVLPPDQCRMPSLASRPDKIAGGELIHLVWEVDHTDGTSDILYEPFKHLTGATVWSGGGPTIISVLSHPFQPPTFHHLSSLLSM